MVFFTSDTHFNHQNPKDPNRGIIPYCKRPFPSIEVMNASLICRWNEKVGPNDTVWHLGDFAFGPKAGAQAIFNRLNGQKRLVRGNHDKSIPAMLSLGFLSVVDQYILTLNGIKLFLKHVPDYTFTDRAKLHLCGHVHDLWRRRGDLINVSGDQWDFYPVTLEELMKAEDQSMV